MSRFVRGISALPRTRPTISARAISTTPNTRSSHGHDSHAHPAQPEEVYPEEGFSTPFWRNSILLLLAGALAYRLSPASLEDGEEPFLTQYIAYHMPKEGLWKERNAVHLQLSKIAADDKLLFLSAEKPKVARMRFPGTFDQASPNGIAIGSQADLSGLRIKSEKEDFAAPAVEEEE